MTVKEIVTEYLKQNGYEGLSCDECCCFVDDLMQCSGFYSGRQQHDCIPGYKVPCPDPGECDCEGKTPHISAVKPEKPYEEKPC